MSQRVNPALLVLVALVALLGVATVLGHGPLAAKDTPAAAAPAPIDTPTATTASQPAATTPAAKPAKTPRKATAKHPFATLSATNRAAFEHATIRLIRIDAVNADPTAAEVREIRHTCNSLRRGAKLTRALRSSCKATLSFVKSSLASTRRCTGSKALTHNCARAVDEFALETEDLVAAHRAYAHVVRSEVPASACRSQLLPRHVQLAGLTDAVDAIQRLAAGVDGGTVTAIASADRYMVRAQRKITHADKRSVSRRVAAFRSACHVG